jgi:hypothetical protein
MKIAGFTGTQNGCTPPQLENLKRVLRLIDVLHHGDCKGADAEAWWVAKILYGKYTVCHPPIKSKTRAFTTPNDETRPQYDYIVRDHHIVDESQFLIGVSKSMEELVRSGTWTTIRYARKKKRSILILWPDGTWDVERPECGQDEPVSLFQMWTNT